MKSFKEFVETMDPAAFDPGTPLGPRSPYQAWLQLRGFRKIMTAISADLRNRGYREEAKLVGAAEGLLQEAEGLLTRIEGDAWKLVPGS